MSLFSGILKTIVGAAEITVAILVPSPLSPMLISSGAGMVISGIGSIIAGNGPHKGHGTATRNPTHPWNVVYGQVRVGGDLVYQHSWGGDYKMLDMVLILACHHCDSVLEVLFDQQRLQLDNTKVSPGAGNGSGTSFAPAQQKVFITTIARDAHGVVTVVLPANIPFLTAGDNINILDSGGGTTLASHGLTGKVQVSQIISQVFGSPGSITFTYLSGGTPSGTLTTGEVQTAWISHGNYIYIETMGFGGPTAPMGNQALGQTFPGMLLGTPYRGDTNNLVSPTRPNQAGQQLPHGSVSYPSSSNPLTPNPWTANCSLVGKAAVFIRIEYIETDPALQTIPQLSFLIQGKNDIYDPNTNGLGYTNNAALCIADYLTSKIWGYKLNYHTDLPDQPLKDAIAICNQDIPLLRGGTEKCWSCNGQFTLDEDRGKVRRDMLSSCAGRLVRYQGQYFIRPAYSSVSTGLSPEQQYTPVSPPVDLTAIAAGPPRWRPAVSIRDLYNGAKGTYVSPENHWEVADIPPYAQDTDHGYLGPLGFGGDANLAFDGGDRRWLDMALRFTTSYSQAQRTLKIELLRRRPQTFVVSTGGGGGGGGGGGLAVLSSTISVRTQYVPGTYDSFERIFLADLSTGLNLQDIIFSSAAHALTTTTMALTSAQLNGLANASIEVFFALEGTLVGSSVPYDHLLVADCYVTVTYTDLTTATLLPTAVNVIEPTDPTSGTLHFTIPAGHATGDFMSIVPRSFIAGASVFGFQIAAVSPPVSPPFSPYSLVGQSGRGTGTFVCNLSAYQTVPLDIIQANCAPLGFSNKQLEITEVRLVPREAGENGVIALSAELDVQETDSDIYVWSVDEELTPQGYVQAQLPVGKVTQAFPYPWSPGHVSPLSGDAYGGQASFGVQPVYGADASGTPTAALQITGYSPINQLDIDVFAPLISVVPSNTGGSLAPGTYVVALSARDSSAANYHNTDYLDYGICTIFGTAVSPPTSPPSFLPTGSITVDINFSPGDDGGDLYMAKWNASEDFVFHLVTTVSSGATTASITSFDQSTPGGPDPDFDHFEVTWQKVIHAGVWAEQIFSVTSNTITINGPDDLVPMTTNLWAGYTLSLICKYNPAFEVPILNMPILSSTASDGNNRFTLTIGPNAQGQTLPDLTTLLNVFDVVVMRANSTFTASSCQDPNWANPYFLTGLNTVLDVGLTAVVLTGADAGDVQTIASITRDINSNFTVINLSGSWAITPADGDLVVICAADKAPGVDGNRIVVPRGNISGVVATVDVVNLEAADWLFFVRTCDRLGNHCPDTYAPFRELYLNGNGLTQNIFDNYTMVTTDGRLNCDNSRKMGNFTITCLPQIQIPQQLLMVVKVDSTPYTVRVNAAMGDTFADGTTFFILSEQGDSRLLKF